jgi:hypothetical protein
MGRRNKTSGVQEIKHIIDSMKENRALDFIVDDGPSLYNDTTDDFGLEVNKEDGDDDYNAQSNTIEITFVEFAIINMYLHNCFRCKYDEVSVSSYGQIDGSGRLCFGGVFENAGSYWFNSKFKDNDNDFIFQTKMFVDSRNELQIQLHTSAKKAITFSDFDKAQKKIMELSFNNSEYKGKCIKVKMKDGRFRGIEIIDIEKSSNELILNEVQKKFIDHFVTRVERGGNARYLLNGEPGTGKTESIREIARRLIPKVTFIIPDFDTTDDLTSIMEACEIFESGVIIMDDIDLYLGSRDNGSYTRLLGQFLSFFDGVKKRKISLLASTNDKGLVDKAAERPGRFNFTLDYNFLDAEQIVKVCNIHLPEKWRIQEVYDALTEKINGKKVNITGAFIANLADNIREMSEDDTNWNIEDTVSLIKESYKGFYSSQIEKEKQNLGFKL